MVTQSFTEEAEFREAVEALLEEKTAGKFLGEILLFKGELVAVPEKKPKYDWK